MTIKNKAIEIYRDLLERHSVAHDRSKDGWTLRQYWENGEIPPDHLLPGRAVMNLTPEDREELKKLTSEEVMKERNPLTYYPNIMDKITKHKKRK